MRKFFVVFFFSTLFLAGGVLAKEPLRTEDAIYVEAGKIVQSGILADSNGLLFIEFSQNARVVVTSDRLSFSGEIVPPQIIALPDNKPRARMQELITFELLGDTAEHLTFADQFDLMRSRSRFRYAALYPESFSRTTSLVQILVPIEEDYGELSLWEYSYEDGWIELGGKIEDSSTSNKNVFSSVLTGTGIFTIFDNNPSPDFVPPFPLDEMTLVEPDPFADEYFTENAAYSTESTPELFEDIYVDPLLPADPVPIEGDFSTVPMPIEDGFSTEDDFSTVPAMGVSGAFSALPLNITGEDPNRAQTTEELYAQKDAAGLISAMPFMLPGVEEQEGEDVIFLEELPPLEEEFVPISDELSQTGPDNEEIPRTIFPFMILFAVMILGSSFYFAIKGKRKMGG